MKKIYLSLLLGLSTCLAFAQFTSTFPLNVSTGGSANSTCTFTTLTNDNVNTNATLNRIGHLQSGTYGDIFGRWAAIGVPNLSATTPNACNLYGFTTQWNTDRFFCGLKEGGGDNRDGMIGWGDDATQKDRLIFAFFNGVQNDPNGTEVTTMYPNGNVGIGPFFQRNSASSLEPQARLEVQTSAGSQLRLTNTQNFTTPANGTFADLQTTSLGDLHIDPRSGGIARRVGIGTSTPATTLHVNGDGMFRGTSRDFRLTNAGAPQANSVVFIDQSNVGSWAGLMIKGRGPTFNYPTLGFSFLNDATNTILGADIVAVPTRDNAGSETMDLTFLTKPLGLQVTERVRIVGRTGYTGFNVGNPTERVDIDSTARLRKMPNNPANVLITGVQQVGGVGDYVLNYLAYPGTSSQVLLGNGTWGTVPGAVAQTANNGLMMSTATNVRWGQVPGTAGNPAALATNTEIPMDDKVTTFIDNASTGSQGSMGIGTGSPTAKVHIVRGNYRNSSSPTALKVENPDADPLNGTSPIIAVDISSNGQNYYNRGLEINTTNAYSTGTVAQGFNVNANISASSVVTKYSMGGQITAWGGLSNQGINCYADGQGNTTASGLNISIGGTFKGYGSLTNFGVIGIGQGVAATNTCYGGMFDADGTAGTYYGIHAEAPTSIATSYAGYFTGNVFVNGTTSGVGYLVASDQKFKKDIVTVKNGLEIIKNINATKYNYDKESFKMMNFPETSQYGFIAQNLEKYAPELVAEQTMAAQYDREGNKTSDEVNFKAVNYIQMIPLLTSAVQELDKNATDKSKALEAELADLKSKYNQLNDLINDLCNNGCDIFKTPTTGSIKPASLLFQNVPNPFTKSTVINYSIAEGAQKAEMLLSDMNGQPLQKISLELTKQGTVSIPSDNLTVGTFTYSLIVDGKLIDTKKMMLTGN